MQLLDKKERDYLIFIIKSCIEDNDTFQLHSYFVISIFKIDPH